MRQAEATEIRGCGAHAVLLADMEDGYMEIVEFARELKLHLDKDMVGQMYGLLDAGMSAEGLVELLREVRSELGGRVR